ncbi:MAG TPA: cold shock domain-containing protein [Puia sp.]|jgi:cold shock CspA family protein
MSETWDKKEREKKRQAKKKEKAEKKQERKENSKNNSADPESMYAYLDENGNLTNKPPDPRKKIVVNAEDIDISVPKQRELNPEDLIRTGIVTFFNDDKGYGFIKDQENQQSVFVHVKSLSEAIKENNKVSFEIEMGPKGANAVNVKLVRS